MGCISSKVIARSISYHEERKQGSRRTANAIPLLEDLIISAKLHSRSFGSNSSSKLATDKLEIPTALGQEGGKQIENDNTNKRSKSWHAFSEHIDLSSLAQETSSGSEHEHNLSSKDDVGSRSFHTVEDYEDMLNRIWLSKSIQENKFNDEDDDEFASNATDHKEDKDYSTVKKMQPHSLHNKCSSEEESKIVKEITSIQNTAPESTIITSSGVKNEEVNPIQKPSMLDNAVQGISTIEKGNKRKALAKRLESLRIPSNIELPAIGSLREWIPASGIYSPGTYVTPKFGSYSLMKIRSENESSEDSIFSPELVSVFEQCMQKLEADEETFLKQIIEDVEEENDEGMQPQPQERTQPSIQG